MQGHQPECPGTDRMVAVAGMMGVLAQCPECGRWIVAVREPANVMGSAQDRARLTFHLLVAPVRP